MDVVLKLERTPASASDDHGKGALKTRTVGQTCPTWEPSVYSGTPLVSLNHQQQRHLPELHDRTLGKTRKARNSREGLNI